jgi:hypothetical protein
MKEGFLPTVVVLGLIALILGAPILLIMALPFVFVLFLWKVFA